MTASFTPPMAKRRPGIAGRATTRTKSVGVLAKLGLFVCIPLFCIPKGGIKAAGLPLTFSYLAIGLACVAAPFLFKRFTVPSFYLYCYLATLPFTVFTILKLTMFTPKIASFAVSLLITVVVIPPVFLMVLRKPVRLSFSGCGKTIRMCVLAVSLFGIGDFVSRNFLHLPLDVPYVTINADDAGKTSQKHNMRGRFVKLMSSYGNGNIYGVCMLMLGPLCFALGAGKTEKMSLLASIFLTLSRTAWFGLVLWALLWLLFYKRRTATTLLTIPIIVVTVLMIVLAAAATFGFGQDFLLDPTLGGRARDVKVEWAWTGLSEPFEVIGEMTYLSIMGSFGFLGLLAFCAWLWFPIALVAKNWAKVKADKVARAASIALVLYATLASIDGAFLLIPVIPLYWVAACIAISPLDNSHAKSFAGPVPARTVRSPRTPRRMVQT